MPHIKDDIDWAVLLEENNLEKVSDPNSTLQEVLKISEETLKKYYSIACEIFQEEKYPDAQDAFMFLTFLNPTYPSFWLGLGCAAQSQADFDTAIMAYKVLEIFDPDNPTAYANEVQCFLALDDQESADESYEKFLELCGDKPEHAQLKQQIEQFKTNWKSKNKK